MLELNVASVGINYLEDRQQTLDSISFLKVVRHGKNISIENNNQMFVYLENSRILFDVIQLFVEIYNIYFSLRINRGTIISSFIKPPCPPFKT